MTRRRDRDATRARLLDAARRRFAEHGYSGTSVRSVAADAGVDPALIFRYFGSKDGLFVAATASEDPAELLGLPPEAMVEGLLGLFADADRRSRAALLAVLRSAGNGAGERRLQAEVCAPYIRALAGGIPHDDADLRAELLIAWVLGVAVVRGLLPDTRLARETQDVVVARSRAVVAAITGPPGSPSAQRG